MSDKTEARHWQSVREVFEAVAQVSPDEREACLNALTADEEVKSDVRELLAVGDETGAFDFDSNVAGLGLVDPKLSAKNPQVVGYRVRHRIGAGGMGAVYLAEKAIESTARPYAIKVVQSLGDSETVIRRFYRERRILASLEHPNICRLEDAGVTEEGWPFLAMPFLEGAIPITEYCDEKRLAVSDRVRLLIKVCRAVQYAHQHLVIHADLKPSNILVTPQGEPMLMDFGISRLIGANDGEDLTVTRFEAGQRPYTPDFASPEQLRGETPSIASDIYALGVVLHELLTGLRPLRVDVQNVKQSLEHMAVMTVRPSRLEGLQSEPRAPNNAELRRVLHGDLDAIIAQCLSFAPVGRYGSVAALADDLSRWLGNLPVQAHPPSRLYETRKFIRRHRLAVTAAALSVMVLLGITVTVSALALRISKESELRRVALQQSEATAEFWAELFNQVNPIDTLENTMSVNDLLQRGSERLISDEDALSPSVRARLLGVIGKSFVGLGDQERALKNMRLATEQYHDGEPVTDAFVRVFSQFASYTDDLGLRDESFAAAQKTSELLSKGRGIDPVLMASSYNAMAWSYWAQDNHEGALDFMRRAVELYRKLPSSHGVSVDLGTAITNYANMRFKFARTLGPGPRQQGLLSEAAKSLREAHALLLAELGDNHPRVAFAHIGLGMIAAFRGEKQLSQDEFDRAEQIFTSSLPPDHPLNAMVRARRAEAQAFYE